MTALVFFASLAVLVFGAAIFTWALCRSSAQQDEPIRQTEFERLRHTWRERERRR